GRDPLYGGNEGDDFEGGLSGYAVSGQIFPAWLHVGCFSVALPVIDVDVHISLLPSIITGQKQLYMDIDIDHGASYGKTLFWDSKAQVPPYLRLANVQFDIDAEKFYKLYIGLMTRPPHQ